MAAIGFVIYRSIKSRRSRVIQIDAKSLDKTNETLIDEMFLVAANAFNKILQEGKANEQVAMTLYSLFKQQKEGDADEFANNKEKTKPERYAAWLQQSGKSDLQCKKEYILLVAQYDSSLKGTVDGVINGDIKEINYMKSMGEN